MLDTLEPIAEKIGATIGADSSKLRGALTDRLAQLAGSAAGWHGQDDIQTLTGLEGTFQWFENPLQPAAITFTFDTGKEGSEGTYQLKQGLTVIESGPFWCVPNNPAIGWAGLLLQPTGNPVRPFVFEGIFTEPGWTIQIALLAVMGERGPILPGFSALRLP